MLSIRTEGQSPDPVKMAGWQGEQRLQIRQQLSDIPLQWMACEAVCLDDGLRLQRGHGVVIVPDARIRPRCDPRGRI